MAIEISNEHGGVGEHREYIGAVPTLAGGFVHVSDVVTADTDDIAEWSRQDVSCLGDVATYIRGSSVFGMECVTHEVETSDGEAAGCISIDICFLEADDVNIFLVCNGTDDTSLGG
jgi:hypothetical protein